MEADTHEVPGGGRVLFEDNHLLAVDKPAGVLSQAAQRGDDCMLERVREYLRVRYDKPGNVFVGLVHRLDRNVSGVLLFARTSKAASRLGRIFAQREIDKRYLAIVCGRPPERAELVDRLGPRPWPRTAAARPRGSGPAFFLFFFTAPMATSGGLHR